MGPLCREQLGLLVPKRFKDRAKNWFQFLTQEYRDRITQDWDMLRQAIGNHFCTLNWYNNLEAEALEARYQQPGYSAERPTDYFIRKLELLQTVHNWTERQLVNEILDNAPAYWRTVIQTTNIITLQALSDALEQHEKDLLKNPEDELSAIRYCLRDLEKGQIRKRTYQAQVEETPNQSDLEEEPAETHFVAKKPTAKPTPPKNS